MPGELGVVALGRMAYGEALALQRALAKGRISGAVSRDLLLLVEHPPVITLGRGFQPQHLPTAPETLRAHGIEIHEIERGGDVTYHGPGQLVGYPIFPVGRRVRDYLRALEQALVATLATYDIDTEGSPGYAGVWAGDAKVVAIGVAVQRHVSFHGFAMNVHTDLSHFETIVPCGLHDKRVTSVSALLGRPVPLAEVKPRVVDAFRATFAPQPGAPKGSR